MDEKQHVILTGDRPTGPLHLGHYVGSLLNRVKLQKQHAQYIMIADVQALTDNFENPRKIHDAVFEVLLDYLAVGIDPQKSTIFIQSLIPEIAELTIFFLNLVTVNRLKRNPTVKTEIQQKQFGDSIPAGFLMYPVSQAADITIVKGTLIPVGEDQLPVIEQTNELVRTFNRLYNTNVLREAQALIPQHARLVGIDGKEKMSKSLGNAIFLSDSADEIARKVRSMYTDPTHLHVQDPGKIEGNVVFTYLDIFDPHPEQIAELKLQYQKGGLGDAVLKKRLVDVLESIISPIRSRRMQYAQDKTGIMRIAHAGTERVRLVAQETMAQVRTAMGLLYF